MFAFALENDALAGAWLDSVIGSLIFWLLVSRPIIISLKTLIAKGKLEKKAKQQREKWEQRKNNNKKERVIEMVTMHNTLNKKKQESSSTSLRWDVEVEDTPETPSKESNELPDVWVG